MTATAPPMTASPATSAPATSSLDTAAPAQPAEIATYVFAVCRDGDLSGVLADVPGHRGGGALRVLTAGGLMAVVQHVPAAEFSEEGLTKRLADRDELEACARAHHHVIHTVAQRAATAPLPLATIYRGDERARSCVKESAARFHATLDHIGDRVEWGIKVYAFPREATPAHRPTAIEAPGAPAGPPERSAGRAYLDRVRGKQRVREQQQDAALQAAEETHRELCHRTVAARRLRAHSPDMSGEHRPQMLNAAYLVDRHRSDTVPEAVEELRSRSWARDVRIDVTGPWVPYSFADGEGAGNAR